MKKPFMILFATSVLLSAQFTQVFAASTATVDKPSEKEINRYLEKAGYPLEVINLLEPEQKENIYSDKGVFVSYKKALGALVESHSETEVLGLNGSPNTFATGVQPEDLSNFVHGLIYSRVTNHTLGKVEFILDYNWDWNYDPIYTMDDQFGIAWTDDFDAYPSSAIYSYRAFGYLERPSMYPGCSSTNSSTIGGIYGYQKYDPGQGIGWKVNLISSFRTSSCGDYIVNRHKGWGQVKIGKAHDGSGRIDSSSAKAQYYHNEIAGSGELQFSAMGPAITLSGDSTYDASPDTAAHWDWYHTN